MLLKELINELYCFLASLPSFFLDLLCIQINKAFLVCHHFYSGTVTLHHRANVHTTLVSYI